MSYIGDVEDSITTKQPQPETKRDWYPYYAGYPNSFVASAIETHFSSAKTLLDPWNGSGTTTAVAALRGLASTGIDINPVATIVARARLTPTTIKDSLVPLAEEICIAAGRSAPPNRTAEPLAAWLRHPAVRMFRSLQHAIHAVLTSDGSLEHGLINEHGPGADSLGVLPAFYYTALFATARDILRPFRASNPTWLKYPSSHRHRISPTSERIADAFLDRVRYLADRLTVPDSGASATTSIRTGSALDLDGEDKFDCCLTSPPYATRIDYVRSSLAELAVLGLNKTEIDNLRQAMTGTPVVKGVETERVELSSDEAIQLARAVHSHESHGSSSYYGPWIDNYLTDLQHSLRKIDCSVRQKGSIGLVVQDSHYKDVRIDLQRIVIEMMNALGRPLRARTDYRVTHSIAKRSPAARSWRADQAYSESLLVFGSQP